MFGIRARRAAESGPGEAAIGAGGIDKVSEVPRNPGPDRPLSPGWGREQVSEVRPGGPLKRESVAAKTRTCCR